MIDFVVCIEHSELVVLIVLLLAQGTVVEGTIQQLFEGHHMNYIECINVDYKSTRKESFYGTCFCLLIYCYVIQDVSASLTDINVF